MSTRILLASLFLTAIAPLATAQSAFHGDAQRSGRSAFAGPSAPTLRWRRDVGGPITSSPVIAPDGSIVLGSVLREGLHPTLAITATRADGTPKWSFATVYVDTQVQTSPAIAPDGTVYVGAQDGRFYALNDDGTLRWSFAGTKPIVHHPVVAPDGTVYVGIDGDLHAFSPAGALLWKTNQGDMIAPGGPSLGFDGTIYVFGGAQEVHTRIYAFRPDGSLRWSYDLWNTSFYVLHPPVIGPDGTIHVAADRLYALNPDGTLKWFNNLSYPLSSYGAPAVDLQGNVYYASHYYAWKLDAAGNVVWQYLINPGCGSFLGHSYGSPLVDANGRVYLGLGVGKRSALPCERKMLVFSPTGTVSASFGFADIPGTSSPTLASDGTLYIGTLDGGLYALR
jgi:outer membrane protein assembly factor BamB